LGLGFRHTRTEFHGGYNEFSVGYAKGAASNLNTSLDDPTRFLKHAEALLIQENFLTGGAIHCLRPWLKPDFSAIADFVTVFTTTCTKYSIPQLR